MIARRWLVDGAVAVLVAAALCLRVAGPFEENARPPDWRAYGLMVLLGTLMLVRRRWPMGVLYASLVILLVYYVLGFGAVGALWPLSPALFNAALLGHWGPAAILAGCTLTGSLAFRVLFEPEPDILSTFSDTLTDLYLGAAVVLAGAMIRNHRRLEAESRAREQAVAAEANAEAMNRLTEQRLRIARDVHDIVAHSLASIGVQARVANELIDSDVAEAQRSIRAILATTADAMTSLRQTVGNLRSAPISPPTLEELAAAVTGVEVSLVRSIPPRLRDDPIEAAIVAIAREALTNVIRHSGASEAVVRVEEHDSIVTLEVADSGRGGTPIEGNGIRGMRERAAAVGGELSVLHPPGGGFTVRAEIPR